MLGPLNMIHEELFSHLENYNIAHNTNLWDGEYHALLLSRYSGYLETDTKMFFFFLKCLKCFSKSGWNYFKISSQSNVFTLIEVIRTVYSPNSILTLSPDIKIVVNVLEIEEVTFTLATNKKTY